MALRSYKAFLSYSHADSVIARRLHKELELFRLESRLSHLFGISIDVGPLYPIFRDEDELPASANLGEDIRAALEASENLIVLCSPAAAQSRWVNQEILAFKQLGREQNIFALILQGEPGGPDECFPDALKFRVGTNGQLTEEICEPIAADARTGQQTFEDAKIKLVAGLLKIPLNDLRQRELTLERKQRRFYQFLAGSMLLLALAAVVAGVFAVRYASLSEERFKQALGITSGLVEEATTLSDRFGVPTSAVESMLSRSSGFIELLSQQDSSDTKLSLRKAKVLLRYADTYYRFGKFVQVEVSARQALALLGGLVKDALVGREARLLQLRAQSYVADALIGQQALDAAERVLDERLDIAAKLIGEDGASAENLRELATSQHKLSTLRMQQSDWEGAARFAGLALGSIAKARRLDPESAGLRRDLAVILEQEGDALMAMNRTETALNLFLQAHVQRKALSSAFRDNTEYLRDLSLSSRKLGRTFMFMQQGKQVEAKEMFEASVSAFEVLSGADPRNNVWRTDLALSHVHVGWSLVGLSRWREAVTAYRKAKVIYEELLKKEPDNVQWIEGGASAEKGLADALMRSGHLKEGADGAVSSLLEMKRLVLLRPEIDRFKEEFLAYGTSVGDDLFIRRPALSLRVYSAIMPDCLDWAKDRSGKWIEYGAMCSEMIGEANRVLGWAGKAKEPYQQSLDLRQILADRKPTADSYYKLSVAHYNLGLCMMALRDSKGALGQFESAALSNEQARKLLLAGDVQLKNLVSQHTSDIAKGLRLAKR